MSIQGWCGWRPAWSSSGRAPEDWEVVWEWEEGQEKAGPEDQDGVGCKNVGAAPGVKKGARASLVVQWLRIRLPMQGTRVRALVREDPTCRGATKLVHHNY